MLSSSFRYLFSLLIISSAFCIVVRSEAVLEGDSPSVIALQDGESTNLFLTPLPQLITLEFSLNRTETPILTFYPPSGSRGALFVEVTYDDSESFTNYYSLDDINELILFELNRGKSSATVELRVLDTDETVVTRVMFCNAVDNQTTHQMVLSTSRREGLMKYNSTPNKTPVIGVGAELVGPASGQNFYSALLITVMVDGHETPLASISLHDLDGTISHLGGPVSHSGYGYVHFTIAQHLSEELTLNIDCQLAMLASLSIDYPENVVDILRRNHYSQYSVSHTKVGSSEHSPQKIAGLDEHLVIELTNSGTMPATVWACFRSTPYISDKLPSLEQADEVCDMGFNDLVWIGIEDVQWLYSDSVRFDKHHLYYVLLINSSPYSVTVSPLPLLRPFLGSFSSMEQLLKQTFVFSLHGKYGTVDFKLPKQSTERQSTSLEQDNTQDDIEFLVNDSLTANIYVETLTLTVVHQFTLILYINSPSTPLYQNKTMITGILATDLDELYGNMYLVIVPASNLDLSGTPIDLILGFTMMTQLPVQNHSMVPVKFGNEPPALFITDDNDQAGEFMIETCQKPGQTRELEVSFDLEFNKSATRYWPLTLEGDTQYLFDIADICNRLGISSAQETSYPVIMRWKGEERGEGGELVQVRPMKNLIIRSHAQISLLQLGSALQVSFLAPGYVDNHRKLPFRLRYAVYSVPNNATSLCGLANGKRLTPWVEETNYESKALRNIIIKQEIVKRALQEVSAGLNSLIVVANSYDLFEIVSEPVRFDNVYQLNSVNVILIVSCVLSACFVILGAICLLFYLKKKRNAERVEYLPLLHTNS